MWMKWRKVLKPKRKFLPWPKVERLEHRICLSTYDYTVIAQTGDQGLVSLGNGASINDSGQVAFVGNFADGSNGIFVGNGSTPSEFNDVTENVQSPTRFTNPPSRSTIAARSPLWIAFPADHRLMILRSGTAQTILTPP